VTWSNHHLGNHPVERSVRTVEGTRQDRVVDVAETVAPQRRSDINGTIASDIAGDIGWGRHPALLGMEE
jgi:hypothetical protein